MTEEEIRPIAEDYVEEYCHCSDGEYTDESLVCAGIGTALIVSRQLEKRIAELKSQIEKMKCCYNCEHGQNECYCSIKHSDICDLSCWDKGCDEWKLKEIEEK